MKLPVTHDFMSGSHSMTLKMSVMVITNFYVISSWAHSSCPFRSSLYGTKNNRSEVILHTPLIFIFLVILFWATLCISISKLLPAIFVPTVTTVGVMLFKECFFQVKPCSDGFTIILRAASEEDEIRPRQKKPGTYVH